jgi:hypothetical protein
MDGNVAGAQLHGRLVNFLAASANGGNRSNHRRDDDNAFETLHGILSSELTAVAV